MLVARPHRWLCIVGLLLLVGCSGGPAAPPAQTSTTTPSSNPSTILTSSENLFEVDAGDITAAEFDVPKDSTEPQPSPPLDPNLILASVEESAQIIAADLLRILAAVPSLQVLDLNKYRGNLDAGNSCLEDRALELRVRLQKVLTDRRAAGSAPACNQYVSAVLDQVGVKLELVGGNPPDVNNMMRQIERSTSRDPDATVDWQELDADKAQLTANTGDIVLGIKPDFEGEKRYLECVKNKQKECKRPHGHVVIIYPSETMWKKRPKSPTKDLKDVFLPYIAQEQLGGTKNTVGLRLSDAFSQDAFGDVRFFFPKKQRVIIVNESGPYFRKGNCACKVPGLAALQNSCPAPNPAPSDSPSQTPTSASPSAPVPTAVPTASPTPSPSDSPTPSPTASANPSPSSSPASSVVLSTNTLTMIGPICFESPCKVSGTITLTANVPWKTTSRCFDTIAEFDRGNFSACPNSGGPGETTIEISNFVFGESTPLDATGLLTRSNSLYFYDNTSPNNPVYKTGVTATIELSRCCSPGQPTQQP